MRHTLGILGAVCIAFASGGIFTQQLTPTVETSELATAQELTGDKNVRLIGFLCGNHAATVIATEEDEFPDGCKEIRELRADRLPIWFSAEE